jgi:hypothetical protein
MRKVLDRARARNKFLSIYCGQTCVGFIVARGKLGFEGFTINEESVELFPNERLTANAVEEAHR